mmetsp:Transcript_35441/g.56507  ORF Transcript_35441/g.56507 Transcript_35441/m.56507 type:complete len:221 (+) Transcript_35441:74-736(+)
MRPLTIFPSVSRIRPYLTPTDSFIVITSEAILFGRPATSLRSNHAVSCLHKAEKYSLRICAHCRSAEYMRSACHPAAVTNMSSMTPSSLYTTSRNSSSTDPVKKGSNATFKPSPSKSEMRGLQLPCAKASKDPPPKQRRSFVAANSSNSHGFALFTIFGALSPMGGASRLLCFTMPTSMERLPSTSRTDLGSLDWSTTGASTWEAPRSRGVVLWTKSSFA